MCDHSCDGSTTKASFGHCNTCLWWQGFLVKLYVMIFFLKSTNERRRIGPWLYVLKNQLWLGCWSIFHSFMEICGKKGYLTYYKQFTNDSQTKANFFFFFKSRAKSSDFISHYGTNGGMGRKRLILGPIRCPNRPSWFVLVAIQIKPRKIGTN